MPTDLQLLAHALQTLQQGFDQKPDALPDDPAIGDALLQAAERLHDNYPYFQDSYAGQMIKPPHAVARLAYMLALYINPNNHALDGGRASSAMEKEAIQQLAHMIGWTDALAHLTSSGTIANLEALWVAHRLHPHQKILASSQAHYTHKRISEVLGIDFEEIPYVYGQLDLQALEKRLQKGDVGTLVLTLGTTGMGIVEPLGQVLDLRDRYGFRLHLDAAYGGYFVLSETLSAEVRARYDQIKAADSLVIDPHKHGLQPYGCGAVLFRDAAVGRFYKHDSPYTYFSSEELHLGEISLECSRAGASAVALWTTLKVFPLERNGRFAREILDPCLAAARRLYTLLDADDRFLPVAYPDLDIVVWSPVGESLSAASAESRRIFAAAAERGLHLALLNYPAEQLPEAFEAFHRDQPYLTCLRSCLMKPTHLDFVPELWRIVATV
ncbi:MAG: pyridoxal phosphate-dependent decarboxylase family protein [Bernardetiaceae bacterium]